MRKTNLSDPHSATAFAELVARTGMKKGALAAACGKNPATFSRYLSGALPVPVLVREKVESFLPEARSVYAAPPVTGESAG